MKKLVLLLALMILVTFILTACGEEEVDVPAEDTEETQEVDVVPDDASDNEQLAETTEPEYNYIDDTDAHEGTTPDAPDAFAFIFRDVLIEMNQDVSQVISALGDPDGEFEAPSCAFDGIDRIFAYPGIQIYTYPLDDSDFIHTVAFFDDSIRTTEGGIRLGANIQAVIDVYGDDYEYEVGMYTFTRGRTVLEFLTDDGIVIGISYRYLIEI
ncbi:MAG: hypothetical protein FWD05_03455 [Oscillospiraceae bacterium]|nr:hypothetical protein [Oscillospiraceae bacterium]